MTESQGRGCGRRTVWPTGQAVRCGTFVTDDGRTLVVLCPHCFAARPGPKPVVRYSVDAAGVWSAIEPPAEGGGP